MGNGTFSRAGRTLKNTRELFSKSRSRKPNHTFFEPLEHRLLLTTTTPDSAQVIVPFPRSTFTSVHTMVRDTAGNIFVLGLANPGPQEASAIYEIPKGTANLTFIASFAASANIRGLAVDSNDNLFTTNENGGQAQKGSVVEIPASNHLPIDIAFFDGTTTGSLPLGDLVIDSSNNLFGTTMTGGANNNGTVWELASGSSTITTLASFTPAAAQAGGSSTNAQGLTIDSATGNIYGTIPGQQLNAPFGGIWELPKNTGTINVIATFNGTNGNTPRGPLVIDSSGNVFGETSYGGTNLSPSAIGDGTLFEINAGSGTVTTLINFNGTNGQAPMGGLVTDSNGNLFGATNGGGAFKNGDPSIGDGTAFELPAGASTITTLVNFNGATTGSGPSTGLFPDGNGNFYVSTSSGGTGTSSTGTAPLGGALDVITPGGGSGGGGGSPVLSVAVTSTTLASTFVPGDHATASVTLSNTGTGFTRGIAKVQLYLSPDGIPADGVLLTTPSLNRINAVLAGGQSRKITGSFVVPANVPLGNEQLVAVVTAISGFANTTIDSTPAVDATVDTAALDFGAVGARKNVHLNTVIAGHKVIATLTGPGEGMFIGSNTLSITGTTAASKITISAAPGFTVSGITADSPIGILNAPHVDSSDDIRLSGGAKTIQLGNVDTSDIDIGGSSLTSLTLGDVVDCPIISTAPFSTLSVKSYTDPALSKSISAPSIRSFIDRGAFTGKLAVATFLTSAFIKGDLNGDILAGVTLGPDNQPGGNDDAFFLGTIGSLRILGNVTSSIIAAGLNATDDTFPLTGHGNDSLIDGSKISSILIAGALSDDSKVLSAKLPPKVTVGHSKITPASDLRFQLP